VLSDGQVRDVRRLHGARISISEIARRLHCGRSTVYRALADGAVQRRQPL